MPHRPEGQGSVSGVVNVNVNVNNSSNVYTPPRVTGSTAAAIMRQQTNNSSNNGSNNNSSQATTTTAALQYGEHSSGVVTPVVKSKAGMAWLSSRCNSNKSSDSTDRSTATTTDDSRSIATMATEDEREATATALLMVAKVAEREQQQHYLKGMVVDGSKNMRNGSFLPSVSSSVSTGSSSTVPLKKRKKSLDILRRQHQDYNDVDSSNHNNNHHHNHKGPCHISPVSHSSASTAERNNAPASNNRAHSYDSKDLNNSPSYTGGVSSSSKGETTQELLDSSKVHSTAQIGAVGTVPHTHAHAHTHAQLPISQVLIPHFPTVLHQVLADKELTGDSNNVIQWLPDGEAWKVVRWDAMRRHVLPKYFSDLRDEHGRSCGTIDAFLYHIDAWGFEEIKNGMNAGAYRHDLFIRGAQKLCVKMRFTSDGDNKGVPKTVSPSRSRAGETERERMMLQVPMLASVGTADSKNQQSVQPSSKRLRYDSNTNSNTHGQGQHGHVHGPLHWPYSNDPSAVVWGAGAQHQYNHPHNESPHARAYGMRAAVAAPSMTGAGPYSPNNGSYIDPRMQLCRVPTSDSMNMSRQQQQQQQYQYQYSPPQVRSGRGALRGIASATTQQNRVASASARVSSPCTTPSFRHGFPVSNRGKGPRKPAACRTAFATTTSEESKNNVLISSESAVVTLSEAQRIGSAVQGVAVAISRKTKRKLPLAAGRKSGPVDSDSTVSSIKASGVATDDDASKFSLDSRC